MSVGVDRLWGHKEWTSRKTDPKYDMNWMRNRVAGYKFGQTEEEDMKADERAALFEVLKRISEPLQSRVWIENDKGEKVQSTYRADFRGFVLNSDASAWYIQNRVLPTLFGEIAGLREAIKALQAGEEADDARIEAAVQRGVEAALEANYQVSLERTPQKQE